MRRVDTLSRQESRPESRGESLPRRLSTTFDNVQALDLVNEARYWKNVALYLADCHAATASDYEAKSVSKSRRSRMIAILQTCIDSANKLPTKADRNARSEKDITDRCLREIAALHAANKGRTTR